MLELVFERTKSAIINMPQNYICVVFLDLSACNTYKYSSVILSKMKKYKLQDNPKEASYYDYDEGFNLIIKWGNVTDHIFKIINQLHCTSSLRQNLMK